MRRLTWSKLLRDREIRSELQHFNEEVYARGYAQANEAISAPQRGADHGGYGTTGLTPKPAGRGER